MKKIKFMLTIKKRRYKPLYKKFLKLKQNVQCRPRLLRFKKQKWNNLLTSLKRTQQSRYPFKVYDHHRYSLSMFSFKSNFRYKLHTKQRLSYFYGGLSQKYLKSIVRTAQNKTKLKKKAINSKFFLIEMLENRLDTVLYRSHFVPSIRSARQLISHNHVSVNKKTVKNKSFILKKGDLVEVKPKAHFLIENNVITSNIWPIPPKYLQINYRTFQIQLIKDIKSTNLSMHFPFWLDLNTLIKYYQR